MARVIGSLEALSESVSEEVQRQVEEIRERARRRAQQMKDEAEERAERIEDEALEDARGRAKEARRERLTEAEREARRRRLAAREALIEQVWDRAEEELRDLVESEAYSEVIRRLTRLAVATLGSERVVVAFDSRGQDLLTEDRLSEWSGALEDELGIKVELDRGDEPLDSWGGLVATSAGGAMRVDASLPSRLAAARAEVRDAVFRRLMGES